MDSLFVQLAILNVLAAVLAVVARIFRQPLVLAYLVTGILLGAGGLHVIPNSDVTHDIAAVGIVFLLFLVGLELDISKVRRLGAVVLISGILQMVITGAVAFGITRLLGYDDAVAGYLGVATAFSSTAVALKLLSDRKDLASLYGRVTIGILLLQDLAAIIVLIVIGGSAQGGLNGLDIVWLLVRGAGLLVGTWLLSRYVLGRVFYHLAKSEELLFLASVAWAFLFALVSSALGFSQEVGAFLAGVSLASLPYSMEIIGRVKSLKDFFLVIFFVVLGLEVSWSVVLNNLPLILALSAVGLFVKSFVISVSMVRLGYPRRPSYLAGTTLGHLSEFSLLIVLLGATLEQIPLETVGVVAAVLITSIVFNTYWSALNRYVYPLLSPPLKYLTGKRSRSELHYRPEERLTGHTLLFGANRTGFQMLKTLEQQNQEVLVIDHNPTVMRRIAKRGFHTVYGDVDDHELLTELELSRARMVISTIPRIASALYLVERTRQENPQAMVIATVEQVGDALALYAAGADYVIVPKLVGGEHAASVLEQLHRESGGKEKLRRHRSDRILQLEQRAEELGGRK